jgi:hypothetical protein
MQFRISLTVHKFMLYTYSTKTRCRIPCLGFGVHTAVAMNRRVLWDITPCSPLKVNDISEEYASSIIRVEE